MVQFSHEEARVTSLEMDLPAVHRVLVRVSVLHNISGSVDLLPRRDVMVSVNSDCFSGSAASSGKNPKHISKLIPLKTTTCDIIAYLMLINDI